MSWKFIKGGNWQHSLVICTKDTEAGKNCLHYESGYIAEGCFSPDIFQINLPDIVHTENGGEDIDNNIKNNVLMRSSGK